MVYADPLLPYIHFPLVDQYIKPYVPFGVFPIHIHEFIFFILFYTIIYLLSTIISPKIVGLKKWNNLKSKDQVYFHIHVVSMIQCIVIIGLILPMYNNEILAKDRVFGYIPYGGLVAAASSGYFLWDAGNALYHIKKFGPGFAVHGVISLLVTFFAFEPFILYYAPVFLLFEISTPFLNIRWFDLKIPGFFNETFILLNNIILISLFFIVRICHGWISIYKLSIDFYLTYTDPRFRFDFAFIILLGNFILDILNIYWFSLMMKIAIKTIAKLIKGETKGLQIDEETIKNSSEKVKQN